MRSIVKRMYHGRKWSLSETKRVEKGSLEIPESPIEFTRHECQRCLAAPALEEVLHDQGKGVFEKKRFLEYLKYSLCFENYEFVLCIDQYMENGDNKEKERIWNYICNLFLARSTEKEVNLPQGMLSLLLERRNTRPDIRTLIKARRMVLDILEDVYYRYIREVRENSEHKFNGLVTDNSFQDDSYFVPRYDHLTEEMKGRNIESDKRKALGRKPMGSHTNSLSSLKSMDLVGTVKKFKIKRHSEEDAAR